MTRDVVETDDPERAHHLIALRFGEHRVRISGPPARFRYRRVTLRVDELEIGETRYTMRSRIESLPYPEFAAVTLTHGRYAVRAADEELRLGPGTTGRYPEVGALHLVDDMASTVVRLPMQRIAAGAHARTGLPAANFRFTTLAPLSPAMALLWQSVTTFARRQLAINAVVASPLARAGLVDLVASTAVAVFPNTTMTINYLPGQSGVGRAIVRRAAEFIEAHAAVPLTVGRIAEACEVSQRALQVAFQRHHGQGPMAFLRAVRLRQAHWDLQHPKPGQTVAETARRWGWTHPGRFAQAYRETYGRHPYDTLRATGVSAPAEQDR
ncbi:AraC family transcriptional regulator [Micromonospora sp. D93]|uniref:helix-turn-helix transcriptional regulator n=1 Tax=Micromonospora sp. D93 TaxID=2824886 RepID=UPI001B384DF8|nr:AraC family transcriptional regulator [Micromonospora sp. D93]MBQ1020932.1 AraC family transcriptional regulator [Micromonospora sp. D93]